MDVWKQNQLVGIVNRTVETTKVENLASSAVSRFNITVMASYSRQYHKAIGCKRTSHIDRFNDNQNI